MAYKDKNKRNEYHRMWRKKNPEKWKAIRDKNEQSEKRKEYRKKWWNENPKAKMIKERFKESHPEIQKKYNTEWREKNPERAKSKYEKYYNSIKGVINRLKKADKKRFKINNTNISYDLITKLDLIYKKCAYCGGDFKPRFEYDHINPFKPFSKTNIIKVCSKCNQSKNNSNLMEWMKWKEYKITEDIEKIYTLAYK